MHFSAREQNPAFRKVLPGFIRIHSPKQVPIPVIIDFLYSWYTNLVGRVYTCIMHIPYTMPKKKNEKIVQNQLLLLLKDFKKFWPSYVNFNNLTLETKLKIAACQDNCVGIVLECMAYILLARAAY